MRVWLNGQKVFDATFTRPSRRLCQWHWGNYASADNYDITLYEDDISIWKLTARSSPQIESRCWATRLCRAPALEAVRSTPALRRSRD